MSSLESALSSIHVAVVVPAFRAADTIASVVEGVPDWVRSIVVVEDGSGDNTQEVVDGLALSDPRVVVVVHSQNRGVGAAMRSGYSKALELGADIVAKMDADGQMDPALLAGFVTPVALGQADYTKGNRFLRPDALGRMPLTRLLGNSVLSFVTKLSSGYWNIMDPTNGYTAISREGLLAIDLGGVDDGYFFESSLLSELGLVRAVVRDVSMPSRYLGEDSHLSILGALLTFGPKHLWRFFQRVFIRYFVADFSAASLLLVVGVPLTAFGLIFGLSAWRLGAIAGQPATAGTVMVAAFTTAGGLYCIVQAMVYDVLSVPQRPLTLPRIGVLSAGELAQRSQH